MLTVSVQLPMPDPPKKKGVSFDATTLQYKKVVEVGVRVQLFSDEGEHVTQDHEPQQEVHCKGVLSFCVSQNLLYLRYS